MKIDILLTLYSEIKNFTIQNLPNISYFKPTVNSVS